MHRAFLRGACLAALALGNAIAGPPFQTDDPEPVDFRHFELYTFGTVDRAGGEADTIGPAVEFNWGALPNVQIHIIVPSAAVLPSNGEPSAFGLGDIETGVKLRFVKETKHRPMIGSFTMFELPTGDAARGLGVGKVWFRLPIWVQKSFGPWTTYGGAGFNVVDAPGYRNLPFAGWLIQRDLSRKLTFGAEVYHHGAEGEATPLNSSTTMVDLGGYYKFRDPGFQLLFAYGHSVRGKGENYAYLGLYRTWGNDKRARAMQPAAGFPAGLRTW